MKAIRVTLALLLAVPFAAYSAAIEPAAASAGPGGVAAEDAASQYECCWIFYLGSWYCVPC